MTIPDWLTRLPIAHRGLHDCQTGLVENTLGAAAAAIIHNFAIECDVQASFEGEIVVFHDDTVDRLMKSSGKVASFTLKHLQEFDFKGCDEKIPTLTQLLNVIANRVPLICEIKSNFDGDLRSVERILAIAKTYGGPLAFKSFDPLIIEFLRQNQTRHPLGIVAEACYDDECWSFLSAQQKINLSNLLHFSKTQPDFLSYHVNDLPAGVVNLFRIGLDRPVMTWTVRSKEQRAVAQQWADQMVFEGFIP